MNACALLCLVIVNAPEEEYVLIWALAVVGFAPMHSHLGWMHFKQHGIATHNTGPCHDRPLP